MWKIVDNKSTNGLFLNGQRVGEAELQEGDTIAIGEDELKFDYAPLPEAAALAAPAPRAAPPPDSPQRRSPRPAAPPAPAAKNPSRPAAKICVECGIKVDTGRPILTKGDVDLNSLYEGARQLIWIVSLLVWVTPLPMPIRSEAFGTRKPYAIWTIAIATILASITFYIAQNFGASDSGNPPGTNLMLWPMQTAGETVATGVTPEMVKRLLDNADTPTERTLLHIAAHDANNRLTDEDAARRVLAERAAAPSPAPRRIPLVSAPHLRLPPRHSGIFNFIMHLGGNLLFMLVFGTRVDALIGNIATAIVYPILAICSAGCIC